MMFKNCIALAVISLLLVPASAQDDSKDQATIKSTIAEDGTGRIVIEARGQLPEAALIFSARSNAAVDIGSAQAKQSIEVDVKILQGNTQTVSLGLVGSGQIEKIESQDIESWSVRRSGKERFIELRLKDDVKTAKAVVSILSRPFELPASLELTHLAPGDAVALDSTVRIQFDPAVDGSVVATNGFLPLGDSGGANRFRTATGGQIKVELMRSSAAPKPVELFESTLKGQLHESGESIQFQLRGRVRVNEPGAAISVLSGNAAIASLPNESPFRLKLVREKERSTYQLIFKESGEYPLEIDFVAKLGESADDARDTDFTVAASAVVPLELSGLQSDVEFHRGPDFVAPLLENESWVAYLPATGRARMQWKPTRKTGEGKLFFTTSGKIDTTVGAGLLRQIHQLELKVLQGELPSLSMLIRGPGEILDVQGEGILGWKITDQGQDRRLDVTIAKPLTGTTPIVVRSQTPLDTFPVRVQGMRLEPIGAVRHSGFLRLANAGSVRLEPTDLSGLTQLAPNQFPGSATTARQVFVYRFPAANHDFTIAADRIQPEINVSQLVIYQLGETDRVVRGDIELDIREAPIREWDFLVPADYSVVSVSGASVADYVAATDVTDGVRNLKLIFGQDVIGRQLISVHLEKNQAAVAGEWSLPRIDYPEAKTVRGDIGVVAAPGFRIASGESSLLTDKPISYFPKPTPNLQQAYRMREREWSASVQIELLQKNVQSDVFHLYSLNQGTVYGSALINYFVTGSPVSEWRIAVPKELGNVMVDGQDVRTWRREDDTLIVTLHQAVLGPYVLLVTFEEKPDAKNSSIQAGRIQPLEVQGERGYIQVVSPMQVDLQVSNESDEMLVLDALELPTEFRLLSTAPSLGTWQYTERPFSLEWKIGWFQPGTTVSQVVEFSEANTRVSRDGELVTDVIYYVKSRGQRTLRITLPGDPVRLWEVIVDGRPVTARQAGEDTLIPLPGGTDPNVPVEVRLRLGKPTISESYAELALPSVSAPVLKTQWNVIGDEKRRLIPGTGTVSPPEPVVRPSGFNWLAKHGLAYLLAVAFFVGLGVVARGFSRWINTLGLAAILIAVITSIVGAVAASNELGSGAPLQLSLPIVTAGETVSLGVYNTPLWRVDLSWLGATAIMIGIAALIWMQTKYSKDFRAYRLLILVAAVALIGLGVLGQGGGAPWFFALVALAILVSLFAKPAWDEAKLCWKQFTEWNRVRRERKAEQKESAAPETSGPATATILLLAITMACARGAFAAAPKAFQSADSIEQQWKLTSEDRRLVASVSLKLTGQPGDRFLLLKAPAVLTKFDGEGLRVSKEQLPEVGLVYVVTIPIQDVEPGGEDKTEDEDGTGESDAAVDPDSKDLVLEAEFQFQLDSIEFAKGIAMPTGMAAVQSIDVEYDQPNWEIVSNAAVRVESIESDVTHAKLLLAPVNASVLLKPKARDFSSEETQFFVEGSHLFLPNPGVVDGRHRLNVRVAQGQVRELKVVVPAGLTVGSVGGPIGSWQFDADSGELKLQIEPAQSESFDLTVETQRSLDPLPAEVELAPLTIAKASGEVGLLAVAFGPEAQPEKLTSGNMSPVNVSDFDASLVPEGQVLHRVYRYGASGGNLSVRVAAVKPEVRVLSKQVLSLGDERIVLGVNFSAEITRAGLFQLSFPLPEGLEVESLSGAGLHHWAELTEENQRTVILHLNGKTLGQQTFSVTLTGPAPADDSDWSIPRFLLNEASRQTGELVVRPTTGIRLRTVSRQNVSEADPRELGGKGREAMAFRLLQRDWNLALGIEKLDPWVTGSVLHEAILREGQTRSNLIGHFNVQNASIQQLSVTLPMSDDAEIKTLRASGAQVSDFVQSDSGSNTWQLKFKRRVVGPVHFRIEYERRGERKDDSETLRPASFPDARQVSYFVAVRSGGRLEIETDSLAEGWQQAEWNSVPQALRQSANRVAPALTLRSIAEATALQVKAIRHSLADALKLRVAQGALMTVLSPAGHQLTSVDLSMEVIQRSSLSVTLPAGGELFSVFVNGESVHSIRQNDGNNTWQFYILPGMDDRTANVRFVYSVPGDRLSSLGLRSPELNVPLENIQWKVVAPKGYELVDNDGNLELVRQAKQAEYDRTSYLSKARGKRQAQAQRATLLLQEANKLLQAGEQSKARWALNSVANQYALDAASNEDARVQLENLQTQQAIVGLNTRRQRLFLDNEMDDTFATGNRQLQQAAAANPILQQNEVNFRPQQLSQLLQGNSTEDNAVLQKIATRLVKHQRAAEPAPQAIIISLPEEGMTYTFGRAVQVAENSPLELELDFTQLFAVGVWRSLVVVVFLIVLALALVYKREEANGGGARGQVDAEPPAETAS